MKPYWHLDDGADTDKLPAWQAWTLGAVIVMLLAATVLTCVGH